MERIKKYIISLYRRYKERNYSHYCKNCSSCGEDGCCSYLRCVFNAMNKNKKCEYPETYKNELLLRDAFYHACMENESENLITSEFVDKMYDIAYAKAYPNSEIFK